MIKRIFYLVSIILFTTKIISAQSTGDYVSTATGLSNWSSSSTWKKWDGSAWQNVDVNDWPGNLSVSGLVSIAGGNVLVDVSPSFSISSLSITSGNLRMPSVSGVDLNISGNFGMTNGSWLVQNAGSAINNVTIAGNINKTNGTLTFHNSVSNSVVNLFFNGTSFAVNSATLNNFSVTGTSFTTGSNFTINGDLIINSGSFNQTGATISFSRAGESAISGSISVATFSGTIAINATTVTSSIAKRVANLTLGNNNSAKFSILQNLTLSGTLVLNSTIDNTFDNTIGNLVLLNNSSINRTRGTLIAPPIVFTNARYNVGYGIAAANTLTSGFELPSDINNQGTLNNLTIGNNNSTKLILAAPTTLAGGTLIFGNTSSFGIDNSSFNIEIGNGRTISKRRSGGTFEIFEPLVTSGNTFDVNYQNNVTHNSGFELPTSLSLRQLTIGTGVGSTTRLNLLNSTTILGSTTGFLVLNTATTNNALVNSFSGANLFLGNGATINRTSGQIFQSLDVVSDGQYNVNYNGAFNYTSGPELSGILSENNKLSNLSLTANGTLTLSNPITISGGTLNISTPTTVASPLINSSNNLTFKTYNGINSTFVRARGTLTNQPIVASGSCYNIWYNAIGVTTVSGNELYSSASDICNVSISGNNSNISLDGVAFSTSTPLIINGELRITGNAATRLTYHSGISQIVSVTGNVIFGGCAINMTGTGLNHELHLSGATNTFGTLFTTSSSGNNLVKYNGIGNQQIAPSNNYAFLEISGTGTKSLSGAALVNKSFTISSGVFDPLANNFTVYETTTILGQGSFTDTQNNGTNTFLNVISNFGTFNSSNITTAANLLLNGGVSQNNTVVGSFIAGAIQVNNPITLSGTGDIVVNNAFNLNLATTTVTNLNTGIVSITGGITGTAAAGWVQGTNSKLTFGSTAVPFQATLNLNASSFVNKIAYNNPSTSFQTISNRSIYSTLELANGGNYSLAGNTSVLSNVILNSGLTTLSGNNIYLLNGATITGTHASGNALYTNGVGRLVYQLNAVPTESLSFPIATANNLYSPARITINPSTIVASGSEISVRAVNTTAPGQLDPTYSLRKHWIISTTGISSPDLSLEFAYQPSEAVTLYEASYTSACFNGTAWVTGGSVSSQTISFPNVTSGVITCTAGPTSAFLASTFYSRQSGNWEDENTWSTVSIGGVAAFTPPMIGSSVVIGENHTVTVLSNNKSVTSTTILGGSFLDLNTTNGHNFGTTIAGTGTLQFTINNTTNPTFPSGAFNNFNSSNGGTVAYLGSGSYNLPAQTFYNNLIIDGTGTKTRSAGNLGLVNALTIGNNTTLQISTTGTFTVGGISSILGIFIDNNNTAATTFASSIENYGLFNTTVVSTPANMLFNGGVNNYGTFNAGAITLANNRSFVSFSPSTIFNSFNTAATSTVTITGTFGLDIQGGISAPATSSNIFIDSPVTVSGGVSNITGNLSISGNGSLNLTSPSSFLVSGTTINNGIVQDLNNTASTTFTGLVTNNGLFNTLALTNPTDLVLNGGFTNNGTFSGASASINIGASRTFTANSPIQFTSGFRTFGATPLVLAGTSVFSFSGGDFQFANSLTINSSTSLAIGAFANFTTSGLLTSNGNLFPNTNIPSSFVLAGGLTNSTAPLSIPSALLSGTFTANQPISFTGTSGVSSLGVNNVVFAGTSPTFFTNGNVFFGGNLTIQSPVNVNILNNFSVNGTTFLNSASSILSLNSANSIVFNGLLNHTIGTFIGTNLTTTGQLIFNANATFASNARLGAATFNNSPTINSTSTTDIFGEIIVNGNSTFTGFSTRFNGIAPVINGDVALLGGGTSTINLGNSTAITLTFPGNVTGNGGITFGTPNQAHELIFLGNIITFSGGLTNNFSTNSMVRFLGTNQSLTGLNLQLVDYGTGVKNIISGTTNYRQNTIIPSSASVTYSSGTTLRLSSNVIVDNQGILNFLGNSITGFVNIQNNGVGTYSIIQTTSGASFGAQFYNFSHLGNGGLIFTNGDIDPVNNLSNGLFANGSGSQYINFNNFDFGDFTARNVTFSGGPTYNVSRTSSTNGVVTFESALGAFAGAIYTNPVPTNYVIWTNPASTYYSLGNGLFSDLLNWQNSGGQNPTISDFTSTITSFVVQPSHTVSLNSDLDVYSLVVNGTLSFENTAARTVRIRQLIDVKDGGIFNVSNAGSNTHTIDLRGNINTNNSGLIDFDNFSGGLVTLQINSLYPQIYGNSVPNFSNIELNPLSVTGGVILITSTPFNIQGSVDIRNNATFNGTTMSHTVAGYWNQGTLNSSYLATTTGTIVFNGSALQGINQSVAFNNIRVAGAANISWNGNITVLGNYLQSNGSVNAGNFTHTFRGDFDMQAGSFSQLATGTVLFNSTSNQTINGQNATFGNVIYDRTSIKTLLNDHNYLGYFSVNNFQTSITGSGAINISGNVMINGRMLTSGDISLIGGNTTFGGTSIPLSMGTGTLIINKAAQGNTLTLQTLTGFGTTFQPQGDINVLSGTLVASNGFSLFGNSGISFTLSPNTTYTQQGVSNSPNSFGTYTFAQNSTYNLTASFDQSLFVPSSGGIAYGNIVLGTGNKSVSSCPTNGLTIAGNLNFNSLGGSFNLGSSSSCRTFLLNSVINTASTSSITTAGTVLLAAPDLDQTLGTAGTSPTFNFGSFIISNDQGTMTRTKTINSVVTVTASPFNGGFSVTGLNGNPSLYTNVQLGTRSIVTNNSNAFFYMGPYTRILTQAIAPNTFINGFTFNRQNLDALSVILFNNTTNNSVQDVPVLRYGSIQIDGVGGGGNNNFKVATLGGIAIKGSISQINGNGPIFVDGGLSHTIAGDWLLTSGYYQPSSTTSEIVFNGNSTQGIGLGNGGVYRFRNIRFKNPGGNVLVAPQNGGGQVLRILGDVIFEPNSSASSTDRPIILLGNWINTASGSVFQQTGSSISVCGIAATSQILSGNNNSFFNSMIIDRSAGSFLNVSVVSDMIVNGNFIIDNVPGGLPGANVDISNIRLTVGGNFEKRPANNLYFNSLTGVIFNGNNPQTIGNGSTQPFLSNVTFTGGGAKTFSNANNPGTGNFGTYNNTHIYTGDIEIQNGNALNPNGVSMRVAGNWYNYGDFTGSSGGTVSFDGINQSITGSEFSSVAYVGSGTKFLTGSQNVLANVFIGNVTVDITSANNDFSFRGNWVNTLSGIFLARQGTVYVTAGLASSIITSASGINSPGKTFYNFVQNKATGETSTLRGDLVVTNNYTNNGGHLTLGAGVSQSAWIGNEFTNNGGTFGLTPPNPGALIFYSTLPGIYNFNPGLSTAAPNNFGNIIFSSPGSTFNLVNNLQINAGGSVSIPEGTLSIAGRTMALTGGAAGQSVITVNGNGTLDFSRGATLQLSNGVNVLNNGGTMKFVGTPASPVNVSRTPAGTTGYTITQNSGTFHAKNYVFQNLAYATTGNASRGIIFNGGTIDGINNFSSGTMSNGFPASNAFINMDNLTIPSGLSITGITFGDGPNSNFRKTNTGTNFITFINASGPRAGFQFEIDNPATNANNGNFIWQKIGKFWSNASGDNLWETASNWSDGIVPTVNDTVYIDRSIFNPAETMIISISGTAAFANKLIIDKLFATSAGINLILHNPNATLSITGSISILTNNTLTGTSTGNNIYLGGDWLNSGTYVPGQSTVIFNGSAGGTNLITSGTSPFNNVSISGGGSTYMLTQPIITNNLSIINGSTLNVGAGNNNVFVSGNYEEIGPATFVPGTGTVFFNGANQSINGSNFYNISIAGTGIKSIISSALSIGNNFVISPNTTVNGLTSSINITTGFTNNSSINAFIQTGSGSVNLMGTTSINGSQPTTFNELYFVGAGTKTVATNININSKFFINSGSGNVDIQQNTVSATGVGAQFNHQSVNSLIVRGANNFPLNFSSYTLDPNSTVNYNADFDQTIAGITYGNLIMGTVLQPTLTVSSKIASGNITANNITVGANANDTRVILNMAQTNSDITISTGIVIRTVTSQIVWGPNGTINKVGNNAWGINANITGFNNVNISGGATTTMNSPLTISGNVQISGTSVFTMGANTLTGLPSNSFTLASGTTLNSAIPSTLGVAFPTGFGSYNVSAGNVVLNGTGVTSQLISPQIYGSLTLNSRNGNNSADVYFTGETTILGTFSNNWNGANGAAKSILYDNGYNFRVSGNVNLYNYPSPTPSVTLFLDGNSQQIIRNWTDGVSFTLPGLNISGLGAKQIVSNNCIPLYVTGDIQISPNSTLNLYGSVYFSGNRFLNYGIYNPDGGFYGCGNNQVFYSVGSVDQLFVPGVYTGTPLSTSNTFTFFTIDNTAGIVSFSVNGGNFRNTFRINSGSNVDMGGNGLTHTFGATFFPGTAPTSSTIEGNWTTNGINVNLNGGNQAFPTFTINNLSISGTGTKSMTGDISINDLFVAATSALNSSAAGTNIFNPGLNNITLSGNWNNNNTGANNYVSNGNKVSFISNSPNINIYQNNNNALFYDVDFLSNVPTTYTFAAPNTGIARSMNVNCNSLLNLNSQNLYLGSNLASGKVFSVAGQMLVNTNSTLYFNNQGSQSILTVSGSCASLSIIGLNSGNLANINVQTGAAGNGSIILVDNGAKIAARFYSFYNLADQGLYVGPTAVLNPVNNFSNGSWNNLRVGGAATPRQYLQLECNMSGINTIVGANFNFNGTPTVGVHYNVYRITSTSGIAYFNFPLSGTLGVYNYERDPSNTGSGILMASTGAIYWPITQTYVWEGDFSDDWNIGENWNVGSVPGLNDNAIIPSGNPNPCVIKNADALCRDLTVSTGSLTIRNNFNLTVNGSATIGLGAGAGAFAIDAASSASVISMYGAWTVGTNGIFVPGTGSVEFNNLPGTYNITPLSMPFYNVTFNNSPVTYNLVGTNININGKLKIDKNATIAPTSANYTINLGGDFERTSGTIISHAIATGTVNLNGGNQSITSMNFHNLIVGGTGTKSFYGADTVRNALTVNAYMFSDASNIHRFGSTNGGQSGSTAASLVINSTGTFDDGGQSHYFFGQNWTGNGAYVGNGEVIFQRNGVQNIGNARFNNLTINNSNDININANLTIAGNMNIQQTAGQFFLNSSGVINNTSGLGSFNVSAGQLIHIRGAYNPPFNFANYSFNATSTTYYDRAFSQTVGGINYGGLIIGGSTTKILAGDIAVAGNLTINANSTLDAGLNGTGYNINIQGNWNNGNVNGSFIARQGNVIFDGTALYQDINSNSTGTKSFYQVTVNKPTNTFARAWNVANTITDNLLVLNGIFSPWGQNITIGGDMFATNGTFDNSGNYFLNQQSAGTVNIRMNGSQIPSLTINALGSTYIVQDNLRINGGGLELTAGTLNANGRTVNIQGTSNIYGTYTMGAGGILGVNGVFNVNQTGTFNAVGNVSSIVRITNNQFNGGTVSLRIYGYVAARNYFIENMATTPVAGVLLDVTSTIDGINNFSDGTFTNNAVTIPLLDIRNDQTLTISGVIFPNIPGNNITSRNVSKANVSSCATTGTVTFDNATGVFTGDTYESASCGNKIIWTGPVTYTWRGCVSNDWFDANNWGRFDLAGCSDGQVPSITDNVIIQAPYTRFAQINRPGAFARNLTFNQSAGTNARLDIVYSVLGTYLTVANDILINTNGDFRTNANTAINVGGNWNRNGGATIIDNNSTISFTGVSGTKSINNGVFGVFGNVVINSGGTYQFQNSTNINGDLTVLSGTLDGSGGDIYLGKNFYNNSTFVSGTRTVFVNPISAGTYTFSPGTSVYNNITMNPGSISTINLGSNLSTRSNLNFTNVNFNFNSHTVTSGDNVGSDQFNVNSGATVNVNQGAFLRMNVTNTNGIIVNNGGTLNIVGSTPTNIATVAKQTGSANYRLIINNGGTFGARYYLFDNLETNGIQMISGSILNSTNNLSDGTFSNGGSNQYLSINTNISNTTVSNVTFNNGPARNIVRTSGTGTVTFLDSKGLLSNYFYEQDNEFPTQSPSSGLVQWSYSNPVAYWTGASSDEWFNANNWQDQLAQPIIPDGNTNTFIVNVSSGSNRYPVLNTLVGVTKNLTLNSGARLTISGVNLSITGGFSSVATSNIFVSTIGSPIINVGDLFENLGTFNPGTSTVELNAISGTNVIANGTNQFYNLSINSLTTTAVNFLTTSNLTILNNLNILSGKLQLGASYSLNVGGNFNNSSAFESNSGTVSFTKTNGTQSITGIGTTFEGLQILGSSGVPGKTMVIASNITVLGTYDVKGSSTTVTSTVNDIYLRGDYSSVATKFKSNGTVFLEGSSTQYISRSGGENFNNLVVRGGGTKILSLGANQLLNVLGNVTLTSGVIQTGNSIFATNNGTIVTGGSASSYIDGNYQKFIPSGTNISVNYETGNNGYSPVSILLPNVTTSGTITFRSISSDNSSVSGCLNLARSVNRTWIVSGNSVSPLIYNPTFNFTSGMIDGGANPLNMVIGQFYSGQTAIQTIGTRTSTSNQALDVYNYGSFQIAEIGSALGTSVTISGITSSPLCQGSLVSLTAVGTNIGTSPGFSWRINSTPQSLNSSNYTTTSMNPGTNSIILVLTSSGTCYVGSVITSNGISFVITSTIGNNLISALQTVCSGIVPNSLTGTLPTGGNGSSFSYAWQSSTTNSLTGFGPASGINNGQNYNPVALSSTTWFRRTIISGACISTIPGLEITVTPAITNNTSIASPQTICSGSIPVSLTGANAGGGTGNYTYSWISSTVTGTSGFTTASGTNDLANYQPSTLNQTTFFRRLVTSGVCTSTTPGLQITVSTTGVWVGVTNSNWNTATNWCGNNIPTATNDVLIQTGTPFQPLVDSPGAFVNNFTISNGVTVTVSGSQTLNVSGNLNVLGSLNSQTSSGVNFVGSGVQSITGANHFFDFTLTKTTTSAPVVLASPQLIRGTLTLSSNARLVTSSSGIMLTLVSNSVTGTARIAAIPPTSTIVGNVNVQRYIPAKRAFRFLTSPIANASFDTWKADMYITSIGSGSDASPSPLPSISNYSEPFAGAQNFGFFAITSGTNTTLPAGVGYRVLVYGNRSQSLVATTSNPTPVTLNQNGIINSGNINIPITYTSTTGGNVTVDGWNLVGNPYPSQINWDLLSISGSSANLDNAYYAYDTRSDNKTLVGSYFNYVAGVATGSRASLAERPNPSIIPSSQGFFVKANASSPTLTLSENMKSALTPTDNFRREPISNLLYITLENGSYDDNTAIRFSSQASSNFDGSMDAYKLANSNVNISSLADDGSNLSINSLPSLYNQAKTIPLVVQTSRTGSYSMSFSNLSSFAAATDMYLVDKLLNTTNKIAEGFKYDFSITSLSGTSGNSRFEISFIPQTGSITAVLTDSVPNAAWSIDNANWNKSGDTIKNIPVGNYSISFATISGFVAPASANITLKANQVLTVSGIYTPKPKMGMLAAFLTPSSIDRGRIKTQWRINNGPWLNSGLASDSLPVGTYTISFSDIQGYAKPSDIVVNVKASLTTSITGQYVKIDINIPDTNIVVVPTPIDTVHTNSIISGINNLEIKTYPNPVGNSSLYVQIKNIEVGNYSLEMFDQTGKVVIRKTLFTTENNVKLTINEVNDLSNGIYLLRISNSKQNYLMKIVK